MKIEKTLYIIIATRRSGHHAVMNWIDSVLPKKGIQINDTDYFFHGKDVYIPQIINTDIFYKKAKKIYTIKNKYDYILFNLEERNINIIYEALESYKNNLFIDNLNIKLIFVMRDFLNFFASKYNHYREKDIRHLQNGVLRWKEYYNEIVNNTNYFKDYDTMTIVFDNWFKSKEYRKNICDKLNGKIEKEVVSKIPTNGGKGSSFTEFEKQNKAQELNVLKRYKTLPPQLIHKFRNKGYVLHSKNLLENY